MSATSERWKRGSRHGAFWAVLGLLVLAIIGLVAASPIALSRLSNVKNVDWSKLSLVGQTYGAVSAVIASLALVAVAISILLTVRQGAAARDQQLRSLHLELLQISLQTQSLLDTWGPVGALTNRDDRAKHLYANLIVSHWQTEYEIRAISETELRSISRSFFEGSVGREFWNSAKTVRAKTSTTRRSIRFHEILAEEFALATGGSSSTSGPPPSPMQPMQSDPSDGTVEAESSQGVQPLPEGPTPPS